MIVENIMLFWKQTLPNYYVDISYEQLLNNQKKPNRLIIFATHNRFFANKADCLLEMTNGSVKTINA